MPMTDDQTRKAVNHEVDNFSIAILGYDRNNPRDGQRLPGDIIYDVERRMIIVRERRAATQKALGALILSVVTAVVVAALTGMWPSILRMVMK